MLSTPSTSQAANAAMLAITSLATRTAPSEPFSLITGRCYACSRSRALDVRLVAGVDSDHVARLDEQRHLDRGASFELGGFGCAGKRVSLEARVRRNNFDIHVDRELHADHAVPL